MKKIIKSVGKSKEIIKSQPEAGKPLAERVEPIRKVGVAESEGESSRETRTKRVCMFCQNKITPMYTDLVTLRRFLTDRAKIVAKERSGVCARHQRAVAKNIKYARHLSLLPFVPKV